MYRLHARRRHRLNYGAHTCISCLISPNYFDVHRVVQFSRNSRGRRFPSVTSADAARLQIFLPLSSPPPGARFHSPPLQTSVIFVTVFLFSKWTFVVFFKQNPLFLHFLQTKLFCSRARRCVMLSCLINSLIDQFWQ